MYYHVRTACVYCVLCVLYGSRVLVVHQPAVEARTGALGAGGIQ